jgi:diguanylate cyclase (GGDEF)-like protein/hemerythrin-like metal-binding protein
LTYINKGGGVLFRLLSLVVLMVTEFPVCEGVRVSTDDTVKLPEPTLQDLIMRFPMPLALLSHEGGVEILNERFTRTYDPACLESGELRRIIRNPRESWQQIRLSGREGGEIEAQAQAIRIQSSILLVVDESPESVSRNEVDQLRERIVELERLSSTDRLTDAWNRGHLDRVIESELSRSIRFRQPVSLVLLDIDHFKRVNDTFGHQTGDSVLRELVQIIKTHIRAADILFRWGGEEFVVLASSTGYRGAAVLAEALRSKVEQHSFATVGPVTISLGVSEHFAAESAETWFARVDEALYMAKHGGRNRVSVDQRGSSDLWAMETGAAVVSLTWLEAYECGEPTIDREHRELFKLGNVLIAASTAKDANLDSIKSALDRLLAHVVHHFADEEALLAQHGYERLASHKQAHARLLARAQELKASAEAGKATLGDIVNFLANDVVARHLFMADRDFYPLFKVAIPSAHG